MALFESFSVVLDLKRVPFKEQKKLKLSITENGGNISHVVNKQCTFIVANSLSSLSSSRMRSLKKYNTPVVGVDYVYDCLEKRVILPVEKYNMFLPLSLTTPGPPSNIQQDSRFTEKPLKILNQTLNAFNPSMREENTENTGIYLGKFRIYTENDPDIPIYPPNFQVAKYSIFEKADIFIISVLELQSFRGKKGWQYRVVLYWTDNFMSKSSTVSYQMVFCTTSEEAIEIYQIIMKEQQTKGLQQRSSLPPGSRELGSTSLQQLLLEKKRNYKALSQEVGVFVELLWTEALGCLDEILKIPITRISLNDVSRAEGLLLHVQRRLKEEETESEVVSLMEEVYTILPHRQPCPPVNIGLISQKLDLCQLMRDVLNASEVSMGNLTSSSLGKYRALNCSIKRVPPGSPEFESVSGLLQDRRVQILQLFHVSRGVELQIFKEDLGNVKRLLHSTSPSSFVGILTRGLLLPRDGVEHHGIQRTDIGYLGSGIYFSNAMSTSVKYSKPSMADGSRLLLVCDVVLGRCLELKKKDSSLSHTPEGYHSLHGVRTTPERPSEFEDDEYVVYSPEQVKLKYVVQFSLEDDLVKGFQPNINTATELELPSSTSDLLSVSEVDDIGSYDPMDNVTAGLLDSTGKAIPLQAIHLKCKLMDLVSEVIIFQKYTNHNSQPIEAKYVFPLDDSAVVCGFEAFVNGKHVIGQVKEKEQARKDYSQAIKKGHGAYLMDQDAPDVFTISVGNLPPHATVLIKVTYVAELVVKSGCVIFLLPGRVAPWQQDAALNQTTQGTVEKVCVTELETQGEFTLDMSIEMPYEIIKLHCITHKVKIKRTDCKVVVRTLTGQSLGSDGFQLSFSLSQIHMPRMWVENHPDKDSQACMLVFYPDFDSTSNSDELILLLDTSESMRGEPQQNARRISLEILRRLDPTLKVNVIIFGEDQKEAFLAAQPLHNVFHQAKMFIMSTDPVGGNTDLWSPLHSLSLLPPSRGSRNILLLSDGHVQNQSPTLQLLREHVPHSRLFTCGLSSTANKHMLRALAQAGGGAYEFFDMKTKHTWTEKVTSQVKRMTSVGCSSVSVKWHQFNSTVPSPVQAPAQLSALFNDCHTLVYGFVQHCTQATLLYDLRDEEIKTLVSTSELQKTKGTLLHKLTASAVIRDFENGSLHSKEAEHEERKAELKSFIIELSKEFSILSQFTSFVAIEERDSEHVVDGFTDIPKLIMDQDVDFLPYLRWIEGGGGVDKVEQSNIICREYTEKVHTEGLFIAENGFYEGIINSYRDEEMDTHDTLDCSPSHSEPFNMSPFSKEIHKCSRSEEVQDVLQEMQDASRFARKAVACNNAKKQRGCHSVPQTSMIKKSMDRDTHLVDVDSFPIDNSAMTLNSAPFSHPEYPSHSQNVLSDCPDYVPTLSASHLPPPPPHLYLGSISPPKFASFHSPDSCPSLPLSSMQTSHHVPDEICALGNAFPPSTGFLESRRGAKKGRTVQKYPPRILSKDEVILHSASSSMEQDQPPSFTHSSQPLMGYGSRSGAAEAKPLIRTQLGSEFSSSHLTDGLLGAQKSFCVTPRAPHSPLTVIGSAHTYLGPAKKSTGFGAMMTPSEFSSLASTHACDGFKREWGAATMTEPSLNFLFEEEHALVGSKGPDARLQISPPAIQHLSSMRKSIITTVKWPEVFDIQHSDGYWECSARLGALLNLDMDYIAIFLKDRGICSLGVRAHADILKLMASLLVLQLMRVQGLEEGKLLRTLFCLEKSPQPRPERWEAVRKAVDWVCWADKQYPCVCSRLEFGLDWESSTHRFLNVDPPVLSPHGPAGKGGCACSFC